MYKMENIEKLILTCKALNIGWMGFKKIGVSLYSSGEGRGTYKRKGWVGGWITVESTKRNEISKFLSKHHFVCFFLYFSTYCGEKILFLFIIVILLICILLFLNV